MTDGKTTADGGAERPRSNHRDQGTSSRQP
jgi:hypothetical protein